MKKYDVDQPGFGLSSITALDGDMITRFRAAEYDYEVQKAPSSESVYRKGGKHIFEALLVLLALPFVLPVVALCALALFFEGGNPFYRQVRLGRNGQRFSILKLRTMTMNAESDLDALLADDPAMRREWDEKQKLSRDPRVTRVGAFLRSTSLDELPQLWNVITGEMSLIGPRPMLPEQLSLYGNATHYFALRPGITGLWQVSARNENSFAFRNEVDAEYGRTLSLWTDIKLIFKTISVMLRRTGC